jgi:hypothetical protein
LLIGFTLQEASLGNGVAIDSDLYKMALHCFGYGRWKAPYWFIGPEQGMASDEDVRRRVEAWRHLGENELDDCREFHERIDEMRWHGENAIIQKTWKQLILLLHVFLGEDADNDCRRDYQRKEWGMLTGKTCVIELSGLPAHSYQDSKKQKRALFEPGEFERIRTRRIEVLRKRMLSSRPELVAMYGLGEKKHWDTIAEVTGEFPHDVRPPILTISTHPVSFEGVKNAYWE